MGRLYFALVNGHQIKLRTRKKVRWTQMAQLKEKSSLKSAPMLWIDLHFGFALRLSLSHSCTHLNRLTPMQERSWSFFYEQHQLLKVYTIHILILYIGWGPVAEWIGHHATTCWFWSTTYIALRSSLTCFMFWNTVGLPVQTSERWI